MELEEIGQFIEIAGVCCSKCDTPYKANNVRSNDDGIFFRCDHCQGSETLTEIWERQHIPQLEGV